MARLLLIIVLLAVFVAIIVILVSLWNSMVAATEQAVQTARDAKKDDIMAPTAFQKIAFVALILVLFGVTSGWLGGL